MHRNRLCNTKNFWYFYAREKFHKNSIHKNYHCFLISLHFPSKRHSIYVSFEKWKKTCRKRCRNSGKFERVLKSIWKHLIHWIIFSSHFLWDSDRIVKKNLFYRMEHLFLFHDYWLIHMILLQFRQWCRNGFFLVQNM